MNERERLLSVLQGKIPDRIPWYADLSYWYDAQKSTGRLLSKYEGREGYLRLHRDTEAGIYLYAPRVWTEEPDDEVKIMEDKREHSLITTIITPVGKIRSVTEYSSQTFSSSYTEHYIKSPEDLKVMQYYYTHRRITPSFEEFEQTDSLWNGYGLPALLAPGCVSPLQTLLTRWAGVETTITLLVEAREEMEKTFAVLEKSDDRIFESIAGAPGQFVIFPENLSGETTGKTFITQYEIPYWQKRIRQLHQAGKFVGIHNDGGIRASLPLLSETELDFVEAITPAPVGDLSLKEIRDITEGKIIVWGCLPGALFSSLYPEDYFKEHLKQIFHTFTAGSGFVLGVADQVPPDADWKRIRLVRELIKNS